MEVPDEVSIEFCTLGMFIIDEIEFKPPTPPVKDILGGAGSYSALGARLFSAPPISRSVGWIVDCGSDFPDDVKQVIDSWQTSCLLRPTPERLTTRGWNGYGDNDHRAFRYTTPKLRLDHDSLSSQLLRSKSFHLICSPLRCVALIHGILDRRTRECSKESLQRPIFIWEPVPDVCSPEELDNCHAALEMVDYVSPNHEELAAFFGQSGIREDRIDREAISHFCTSWLEGRKSETLKAVVVRCGREGCYVATRHNREWLPAYHESGLKVVDPTGGGNTYLGGLAIALARGENVRVAAVWGSVAASFAIEQIGMPTLTPSGGGTDELWNGERVADRLANFMLRL